MRAVRISIIAVLTLVLSAGSTVGAATAQSDGAPKESETPPPAPASVDGTEAAVAGELSGVLETPTGSIRWTRVPRERQAIPEGRVLETAPGLALLAGRKLYRSSDGGDWTVDDVPVTSEEGLGGLGFANGSWWLAEGTKLLRSDDGRSWQPFTAAKIRPPMPAGLRRNYVGWRGPFEAGDSTVFLMNGNASIPGGRLGYPKCTERIVPVGRPGVYRLMHDERCRKNGPVVRFVEKEHGLRVELAQTGKRLGFIAGADLGDMELMAQGDEYDETQLVVVEDGSVSTVERPWPYRSGVSLFSVDGGLVAIVTTWGDRPSHAVWRSRDGREWEEVGPLELGIDLAPETALRFVQTDEGIAATAGAWIDEEFGFLGGWDSRDGVTWELMPGGLPEGARPLRAPGAWFATETWEFYGPVPSDTLWVHADSEWVSLEPMGFDCGTDTEPIEKWVSIAGTPSTTAIWANAGCEGEGRRPGPRHDVWLLEHSAPS